MATASSLKRKGYEDYLLLPLVFVLPFGGALK